MGTLREAGRWGGGIGTPSVPRSRGDGPSRVPNRSPGASRGLRAEAAAGDNGPHSMVTRKSRRAVVLGGAGFLGSHLTEALLARGRAVRVFDRLHADLKNLEGLSGDWELLTGDFMNEADQREALAEASVVFHLISTTIPSTSNENPVYDVETNLIPTVKLLEAARAAGVETIVFVSSGGTVYGKPQSLPLREDHPTEPRVSYGIVKLAIEKYLRLYTHQHGIAHRILRLSNPYGPRQDPRGAQGAAAVFLGKAHRGETITIWGDGSVVRDYLYVTDAIEGVVQAAESGSGSSTYNIGSGTGVSLNELVEAIRAVAGREVRVEHVPGRPFDVPANVLDVSRARRDLGWEPRVSLQEGLSRTWAWLDEASG